MRGAPIASLFALSALAACATTGGADSAAPASGPPIDQDARARIAREDILTQMAFWAQEYTMRPNDLEAARRFSAALRAGGRNERAAQVAGESLQRHDGDPELLRTLGLAYIGARRPQEALRPLALAARADERDWRSRSALGVALDQLGRYREARMAYEEALGIEPEEPTVLTNLGVSHLMAGEPEEAEAILRRAAALPNAPPAARQNLALAVGLQGRFAEAEQLERIDLPPHLVAENMDTIRGLLRDGRSWSDLAARN